VRVLVWLAVPLAVTSLAVLWALWSGRPHRSPAAEDSAEAYSRFRDALQRPHPERARTVVRPAAGRDRSVAVRPVNAERAARQSSGGWRGPVARVQRGR
jgi:hypothetical protein